MTLEELRDLIEGISGHKISSLIENQIFKLFQEGFTYKEIGRCVYYFYVIKQNDISKLDQYGIAIVHNVRNAANQYYDNLKNKQEQQKIAAERIKSKSIKEIEIDADRRSFNRREFQIDGIK